MYHGSSRLSTTSSPSKLDFTKPCLIEGAQASQTKVIAHGKPKNSCLIHDNLP